MEESPPNCMHFLPDRTGFGLCLKETDSSGILPVPIQRHTQRFYTMTEGVLPQEYNVTLPYKNHSVICHINRIADKTS